MKKKLNKTLWISVCLIFSMFLIIQSSVFAGKKDKDDSYLKFAEDFAKSDIVKEKSCVTCHTIGESGGTVGPILNMISNRRSESWLRKWFADPNSIKTNTKMPNFQFSEARLDELIGYLKKMKRDVHSDVILKENDDPVKAGEALFEAFDCFACHRIGEKGRFVGPNLTWIGIRKSQEWEANWLKDPSAYKPGTFMPNFNLSNEEIKALTSFLHSLQGQNNEQSRKWESMTTFILGSKKPERGRLVEQRLACWSCHGEGLTGGVKNPNSKSGSEIPSINAAYIDFSEEELKDIILNGLKPEALDPAGVEPIACPSWKNALTDSELRDLLAYLESIIPEDAKWDFE